MVREIRLTVYICAPEYIFDTCSSRERKGEKEKRVRRYEYVCNDIVVGVQFRSFRAFIILYISFSFYVRSESHAMNHPLRILNVRAGIPTVCMFFATLEEI